MKKDFEPNLGVLTLLTEALTVPRSLDDALQHITAVTCTLMNTEQAAFLSRDEETKTLIVRTVVGIDSPDIKVGHPLNVPPRFQNILRKSRNLHQINWLAAGVDSITFPILSIPVMVRGARVGLLIAAGSRNKANDKPYDAARRKIFLLLSSFASLAIENSKAYDILNQHFVFAAQDFLEQNKQEADFRERSETQQLVVTSLKNPTKAIKLLTESFFKELAQAGFTAGHITTAAAHLLELITQSGVDATGRVTLKDSTPNQ